MFYNVITFQGVDKSRVLTIILKLNVDDKIATRIMKYCNKVALMLSDEVDL